MNTRGTYMRAAVFAVVQLVLVGCTGGPTDAATPRPAELAGPSASVRHYDAHDGGVVQAGPRLFYLFGTSYDCGFEWGKPGTRWCGVNIYRSRDLDTWRPLGLAFDPGPRWQRWCSPGGCFRPHVVYNPRTGRWVMWLNVFSGTYRVLTAPAPEGPWRLVPGGEVRQRSGDANLFVDRKGRGWLIRTDLDGRKATDQSHELVIERLGRQMRNVVGRETRPGAGFVEAGMMWQRGRRFFIAYSDPACPYCPGTGTSVRSAPSPRGPWSEPYQISPDSCGGQPTHVSTLWLDGRRRVDLFQSDQWVRETPGRITSNQSAAAQAWAPLTYRGARVAQVRCP